MWKIFSEIKKNCDVIKNSVSFLKKTFYQLWWNVFLHQPTWNPTHFTEILMDDTIFWHAIHLPSDKISPAPSTFPPPGLSQPLFLILSSLPSPSFIPGDIVWSGLDFTACKPNTKSREGNDEGARKRGSAAREAHKQTDNWVWWCHSRLLAHYFSLFFFCPFFYCCVHPLWRESWTSVYTLVCWNEEEHSEKTSELTENCQKSPSPVKQRNIYIQNQNIKQSYLFFHYCAID